MPTATSIATTQATLHAVTAASQASSQASDWLAPGSLGFELLKGMPAAFVALVIGLVAALIAYRQSQIAHAKLKLDLFEHRYELYMLLWEFLSDGTVIPPPTDGPGMVRFRELHAKYLNAIPRAYFLFGQEIGEFFDSAAKNAMAHNAALRRLREFPTDSPERPAVENEVISLEQWATDARGGLRARFSEHMNFERWRG